MPEHLLRESERDGQQIHVMEQQRLKRAVLE
jgi:hypothetical protein